MSFGLRFLSLAVFLLVSVGNLRGAVSVSGFSPPIGYSGDTGFITITGTGFSPGTLVVKYGTVQDLTAGATSATSIQSHVPAGAPLGQCRISVSVNGGGDMLSPGFFTVIGPGPYCTNISPNAGGDGTAVTLKGVHLMAVPGNGVTFDGKAGSITSQTDNQIVVNSPNGSTTGFIVVTSPLGSFTNSSLFFAPPVITGFAPSSGRANNGITINGTNFLGTTAVWFSTNGNFIIPAAYTVLSNRAISVTIPTNAVTGKVEVDGVAGIAQSTGSVTVQPALFGFSPTNGGTGTTVTITGANINGSGTPSVSFNGTAATVGTHSFNQITALVPAGATVGPITVTTSDGSDTSAALFYPPPSITTFSPTNSAVGSTVKVTGVNFSNATQVNFNGAPAQSFKVTNNTTLGAVVPSGVSTGPISVTAPGGTFTTTARFYGAPLITGFAPTHGLPGTNVTLTGTNFLDASIVKFNGSNASSVVVVDNGTLKATVPTGAQTGPITLIAPGGTNTTAGSFLLDYSNDIVVTLIDAPDPVAAGSSLVYTITIFNNSPFAAPNVQVTNTLPAFVNLSLSSTSQGSLDTSGNPVLANLGTLNANSSATVTLTVIPQSGGFITNNVSAGGGFPDPVPGNNATNAVTSVQLRLRAFRTSTNTVVVGWPAPSTGYQLQQRSVLATPPWAPVTNTPNPTFVTNSVTTNENQVILSPQGDKFFRLTLP